MSTDTEGGAVDELRERISNFLRRNFSQIQMPGGSAAIKESDVEEGRVAIQLGGACSGCGISPMTIQAIKTRMTQEIPEIDTVHAMTGESAAGGMGGGGPSFPGESRGGSIESDDDEGPQAPF
jgi:Fe-S cluster biogenesis protein NfuA